MHYHHLKVFSASLLIALMWGSNLLADEPSKERSAKSPPDLSSPQTCFAAYAEALKKNDAEMFFALSTEAEQDRIIFGFFLSPGDPRLNEVKEKFITDRKRLFVEGINAIAKNPGNWSWFSNLRNVRIDGTRAKGKATLHWYITMVSNGVTKRTEHQTDEDIYFTQVDGKWLISTAT